MSGDPLGPATGILIAVVASATFWILLYVVARLACR